MQGVLHAAVTYLCVGYPRQGELSKARLKKMLFLADWRAALISGRQLTPVSWEFSYAGPCAVNAAELIRKDGIASLIDETPLDGAIEVYDSTPHGRLLTNADAEILDHVLITTSDLEWAEFSRLVFSTYPCRFRPRYSLLDLVELASEYVQTLPDVTSLLGCADYWSASVHSEPSLSDDLAVTGGRAFHGYRVLAVSDQFGDGAVERSAAHSRDERDVVRRHPKWLPPRFTLGISTSAAGQNDH